MSRIVYYDSNGNEVYDNGDERIVGLELLYSDSEAKHIFSPAKPITNADRIRAMTDEELAKWRSRGQCPTGRYHGDYDCMNRSCKDCWLEWLKEESEGE